MNKHIIGLIAGSLLFTATAQVDIDSMSEAELRLAVKAAVAEKGAQAYITEGLIYHLDGIENVGYGLAHSDSATSWAELTGNGSACSLTNEANRWSWKSECLHVSSSWGTPGASFTCNLSAAHTVEAVALVTTANTSAFLLNGIPSFLCAPCNFRSTYLSGYGGMEISDGPYFSPQCGMTYTYSHSGNLSDPVRTYLTGGLAKTGTPKALLSGEQTVYIGNRAAKSAGLIGDFYSIRIYNRELSAAEIWWNASVDRERFATRRTSSIITDNSTNPRSTAYSSNVVTTRTDEDKSLISEGIDFLSKIGLFFIVN